jgi:anti-sigma-K factor RskA
MSRFLKKLDDDDAMLMLYVSGEMAPEDKAQVERRLATDAPLRARLSELQVANALCLQAMNSLSAVTAPALSGDYALDRACRATRQWATRRRANPVPAGNMRLRLPLWAYPVAAAAAVLVAVTSWSVNHHYLWMQSHLPQFAAHQTDDASVVALNDPSLTDQEQKDLLIGVGRAETASSPLDEADGTIASIQNADDKDSLFLGMDGASDNREGTR